jgi:hypothetical protein
MKKLIHGTVSRWRKLSRAVQILLITLIVLLIAARVAMPVVVERYVNHKLDELPDYDGRIQDVDIHLIRGAYSIDGVNIVKTTGDVPKPFVVARKVDLSMEWNELFHGALVGEIFVEDAQLNFVKAETEEQSQTGIDRSWVEVVKDLFPFKINRFAIRGGEIWFHDLHSEPKVDVYITNVLALATNLTNTRELNTKYPADLNIEGATLGEGKLNLQVKIDPLAKQPTFKVAAGIKDMNLTALNELLEAYAKVNVKRGTFEVFTEIESEEGRYEGYVKPFFVDLDVFDLEKDIKKNPLKFIWQAIVAGAVKLFKNHPKDQVATKIPISGSFEKADVDIWVTIGNLLRNAFVQALAPGLDRSVEPRDLTKKQVSPIVK